jgi:PAS domain-containing protein
MLTDITGRKEAEAKLKEAHENLENLVKERTADLEKAYNSLKESEKSLAEAQKIAHIGNWECDIASDKAYWSNELYRIFGCNPQESAPPYKGFLNYVHTDDRDYVNHATSKVVNEKPSNVDFRIILSNGENAHSICNPKLFLMRIKSLSECIAMYFLGEKISVHKSI